LTADHHFGLTGLRELGHDERRGDHVVQGFLARFLGELRGAQAVELFPAALEFILQPPVEQTLALGVGP
jgi:hypothetical protein